MYTHKCYQCEGSGSTPFSQRGGKCYTCDGKGEMDPADLARENQTFIPGPGCARPKPVKVKLSSGDTRYWNPGALVLAEFDDHLEWAPLYQALRSEKPVLVPDKHGINWMALTIVDVEGASKEIVDDPFA